MVISVVDKDYLEIQKEILNEISDENIIYEFLIGKDKFNEIKKELENNSIKLNIEKELLVEL